MLTSLPVWAVIMAKVGNSFGYNVLISKLPNYLESIFKMEIRKNGMLNALIYVALTITSIIGGPLSDVIRRKNVISVTKIRKIFLTIGKLK